MAMRHTLAAIAGSTLLATTGLALASDLAPYYGESRAPQEFGHWYIRGDVSYDFRSDFEGDRTAYTPMYTLSQDFKELSLEEGVGAGIGMGYQFTPYLRGDLTARYESSDLRGSMVLSGLCGFDCYIRDNAQVDMWDLMANAYVDLGTYAGLTPYIGGGIGAVNVTYADAVAEGCMSLVCIPVPLQEESSWRFAYNLSAGVAYDVSQNVAIDVGYRYLHVEEGSMPGLDLADLGVTTLSGIGVASRDNGFDRHTIQAGLRFKLR